MDRIVLGLVPSDKLGARDPRTRTFMRALEERIGAMVVERNAESYEDLERDISIGRIDIAWLPPMVYARLERDGVAQALLARRLNGPVFWSAMVTSARSHIERLDQIVGTRIAWVDPLSASGYLVARMGLRVSGIDPPTAFAQQFFVGSHAEAVNAVLSGQADVAATFVHIDGTGNVTRGAWDEIGVPSDRVRVLAVLGAVPPDVLAARTSVPTQLQTSVGTAVVAMATDPRLGQVVDAVFGTRAFDRGSSAAYIALREMLERAVQSGGHRQISFLPPKK